MKPSEATSEIIHAFPHLKIQEIVYVDEGFDNVVFQVNKDLIFRFAKHPETSGFGGSLVIESKLLPLLQERLEIAIPKFEFVATQQNSLPFVGYKKVGGIPLSAKILDSLTQQELEQIFHTISQFLITVHDFSLPLAQSCGVEVKDFRMEYTRDKESIVKEVFPLIESARQTYLLNLLNDYLNNDDNFSYTPSLLHADLWLSHIYFDESIKKIIGIIDFGDATIGDPDYDFMQIHQDYGDKALDLFEKYIPDFDKDRGKRKALFFQKWNIVQDLMFFKKMKNKDGVDYNLKKINTL